MKRTLGRWRGRARRPQRASEVLGTLLDRHGAARQLREHRIVEIWQRIVGPALAQRTTPDGLENKVLWVRVQNASWMQQLEWMRSDLLERLGAELGDPPVVTDIRFHLGRRTRYGDDDSLAPTLAIRRPTLRKRMPPAEARGAELSAIEDQVGTVADPELREAILSVRRRWNL